MQLLLFEPRLGGHHLSWLGYVAKDLLSVGHRLTLAIDGRPPAMRLYREHLRDLLPRVAVTSAFAPDGRLKNGGALAALDACLNQSRAEHAFVNNLDEFASSMLRRAAVGVLPPPALKGRLSGVYFRPRFLANPWWPVANVPKRIGFARLAGSGWFHRICLLDEYLCARHRHRYPGAGLTFLPDTWSGAFDPSPQRSRRRLGIPADRLVLLHYGLGTRRKGLHLIVRALSAPDCPDRWHLLCAGQLADDEIAAGLQSLAHSGRATVLNRYVSTAEEATCFSAADIVLLPYVDHFGSSGVLALAAAAGKMVIATDGGLIGRRMRAHQLGLCFTPGSTRDLARTIAAAETMLAADPRRFAAAARRFAKRCDRKAFARVLHGIYPSPKNPQERDNV